MDDFCRHLGHGSDRYSIKIIFYGKIQLDLDLDVYLHGVDNRFRDPAIARQSTAGRFFVAIDRWNRLYIGRGLIQYQTAKIQSRDFPYLCSAWQL